MLITKSQVRKAYRNIKLVNEELRQENKDLRKLLSDVKLGRTSLSHPNIIYHSGISLAEQMRERANRFIDEPVKKEPDMVNHPPHYIKGGIEVRKFILAVAKTLPGDEAVLAGNVIKYVARYRDKFDPVEDLKKAENYLKELIELVVEKEKDKK